MFDVKQFSQSDRLPTLPNVAMRLLEIAQQECPDFKEVSQVIRTDPVISGKILKTVNSSLFAFTPKIESIEQAIPKLGVTLIRTLVLSFHLSRHKTHQAELEPVLQKHWRSSLTQAVFAELIAEELGPAMADPSTCFLAAMLQDIGILAMISEAPQEYLEHVLANCELPAVGVCERGHFGFSHSDVSVAIVEEWGMENSFIEAIRHHHDPVVAPLELPATKSERLKIVLQAANLGATVLASSRASKLSLNTSLQRWVDYLRVHFDFTETQADELISDVNRRVEQYSIVFNFNIGEDIQADDVVAQSKILLQEIALTNQLNMIAIEARSDERRDRPDVDQDPLYRDSLCNLFNRRYVNEHLAGRLQRCVKKRKALALLFLDVDKFKRINDTWGHDAGDQAIIQVAKWLNCSVRKNDVAIRLGGDEFIVVLESVTKKDFVGVARRIAKEVPDLELDGESVPVGLSIGCAFYQPKRGDTADLNWLIKQADQAMYRAKKDGGSQVSIIRFEGKTVVPV